jgi:hypothetical protein
VASTSEREGSSGDRAGPEPGFLDARSTADAAGGLRPLLIRSAAPSALGIEPGVLAAFAAKLGPLAIVDLETTGLSVEEGAELLELGALLVEPGREDVVTLTSLVRPRAPLPRAVARLTGLSDASAGST